MSTLLFVVASLVVSIVVNVLTGGKLWFLFLVVPFAFGTAWRGGRSGAGRDDRAPGDPKL